MFFDEKKPIEFDALKLTLASPELIRSWSHGEVVKPETVNYRTQKPEKGGLFAEEIFGPSKDWECYCGKYKKVRYKGIVCDKCGVEVTRSVVRRERMGHIDLAAPASHIWFLRGVPSKIGLMLDLSPQALEKVIYFADFIITRVDEDLKKETLEQIRQEFKTKKKKIISDFDQLINSMKVKYGQERKDGDQKQHDALLLKVDAEVVKIEDGRKAKLKELEDVLTLAEQELKEIKPLKIISEHIYQDLSLKYGHIFDAGIGAEAVRELLSSLDLEKLVVELDQKSTEAHGLQKDKVMKRLRLAKNFFRNSLRPEWMVLSVIPVIPPDLRPMVPLDGGRFATSDLNDLYRRIINRNNRLKQLQDLNAPEVITRNEKRMLQEAVDALIDNNARHGKTVTASTGQKRQLKSLADVLKGKQGRFRQNLLGKRIDYSGRSVIVVGPRLRLDECGLPKRMALELFKPFVISRLIRQELVHNVRSANRFIESGRDEVWDILEDIVKDAYVLLNRAPTLHRLGIQAFRPKLIEGKAIQVHPLVCEAFNADFDGDQMAVHVPLTKEANAEARDLMLSSRNLLKPATGDPIAKPTKDIIWGVYYMTMLKEVRTTLRIFSDHREAILAYRLRQIAMQEKIIVRIDDWMRPKFKNHKWENNRVETSVGRILVNQVLPEDYPFQNVLIDSKAMRVIISTVLDKYDDTRVVQLLDDIKEIGFHYLTRSGFSWGMDDVPHVEQKDEIIAQAEIEVEEVENQHAIGLLTDSERHTKIIETWMNAKDKIVSKSQSTMDPQGPVYSMVESGARGSWSQLIQIVGMKGLVTNPAGEIIELPVKGNFKEGFDVLEYFISTHGARKGLTDTALRTANAGYLTRRLIDVAQDLLIVEDDCGDEQGSIVTKKSSEMIGKPLIERVAGRFMAETITAPRSKKPIISAGEMIDRQKAEALTKLDLPQIKIRSALTCKTKRGICKKCYGWDLGRNHLVEIGTAVGIIAAQSIGEPGTQLTMRTFHTGGVAGLDITQGLPRVEEIFESRIPKHKAFIAEVAGKVRVEKSIKTSGTMGRSKVVHVEYEDAVVETYPLVTVEDKKAKHKTKPVIKDKQDIKKGDVLFVHADGEKVVAKTDGVAAVEKDKVTITSKGIKQMSYTVSSEFNLVVADGDLVGKGDSLTDGSHDLRQLFRLRGLEATQRYIMDEVQHLYTSQGQKLNDKHLELMVRQMFSRVLITEPGNTELMVGERITATELQQINDVLKKNQKPASGEQLLLGITKVALSTSSFLSAVSFQETSRVLINAAVEGKIDRLEGLKENVIIGRLVPAGTGFKGVNARK